MYSFQHSLQCGSITEATSGVVQVDSVEDDDGKEGDGVAITIIRRGDTHTNILIISFLPLLTTPHHSALHSLSFLDVPVSA